MERESIAMIYSRCNFVSEIVFPLQKLKVSSACWIIMIFLFRFSVSKNIALILREIWAPLNVVSRSSKIVSGSLALIVALTKLNNQLCCIAFFLKKKKRNSIVNITATRLRSVRKLFAI